MDSYELIIISNLMIKLFGGYSLYILQAGVFNFFQILFDELARPQCEGNQLFLFVLSAVKSLQA